MKNVEENNQVNIKFNTYKDPIEAFKYFYKKRFLNECSQLIIDIFDSHSNSFRKALMLSECIPNPLGRKYNDQENEFILEVLKMAYLLSKEREFSPIIRNEINQIYVVIDLLNTNNKNNVSLLNKNEYDQYNLAEQLMMICLHLQDQSRLFEKENLVESKEKKYITGMESAVANRNPSNNPNFKMSILDNVECLVESYDILIRYLYYKKSSDLKVESPIIQENITHLLNPSFIEVTYLAVQRNNLSELWDKFKYSNWKIKRIDVKDELIFIFEPDSLEKYKQHVISCHRRTYTRLLRLYKYYNKQINDISNNILYELSNDIILKDVNSLYSLDKDKFLKAKYVGEFFVTTQLSGLSDFYFEKTVDNIKLTDIGKCYVFLYTLAQCYKMAAYKNFEQDNVEHYQYLSKVVSLKKMSEMFSAFFDIKLSYAQKILMLFVLDNKVKSESDIFCKPLLLVANDNVILCPFLIEQWNLNRTIEMLYIEKGIDMSPIGKKFERELRTILSFVSTINVNTKKLEFCAYDGRNVEFDFIGTFEDYLLIIEFKALVTPYSDKRLQHGEEVIREGVDQVIRRSKIIQKDWDKIKEICDIELPEKPFEEYKVIKLVATNIFDFNTLVFNDVRIVDESTLLKFFTHPIVSVSNSNQESIYEKKIWKGDSPTVQEFLNYLENPVTTEPYNDCFETKLKQFDRFEGDIPYAILDQCLIRDPYAKSIEEAMAGN